MAVLDGGPCRGPRLGLLGFLDGWVWSFFCPLEVSGVSIEVCFLDGWCLVVFLGVGVCF